MKTSDNLKIIEETLARYGDTIYPSKESLLQKLAKDKIRIYLGIDPTGPDLHLGHSTNFLILRQLQKLGHTIILLIGDFTARIGDPTDKLATRKRLSKEEVFKNAKTYQEQAGKILAFTGANKALVKFNSQWLDKLKLTETIELAAHLTVDQLRKRDMFKVREKEKKEIYVHEFLYPLMQGYDSVAMKVDAEIGGTDQTFNMLVGRNLIKSYIGKEKFIITTKLLGNPKTGKKLMSKSEGHYISLQDNAEEMYGKVMALPDQVIISCFKLCTETSLEKIADFEKELKEGVNPMLIKKALAEEIVRIYYGETAVKKTGEYFEKKYQSGSRGEVAEKICLSLFDKNPDIIETIMILEAASSRNQAKRLVQQKAFRINQQPIIDINKIYQFKKGDIIEIGKHRIYKLE